ncbi:hypothetical protein DL764_002318 [Monosporascus ibericus]|uniref:SCP domain-containing protein n=1 Tax=Monosporascus ibericus TaxID=155417 RepID=A0A4Q4TKY3_9PEZI|nr:hypothetical protein DL764_002318 [Monosporascus ibericus]
MLLSASLITGLVLAARVVGAAKLDPARNAPVEDPEVNELGGKVDDWWMDHAQTGCTYRRLNESGLEEAKHMAAAWGDSGKKVPFASWHVWSAGNVSIWICNCRKAMLRRAAQPVVLEELDSVLQLLRIICGGPQPTSGWVWVRSWKKAFAVDHAALWEGVYAYDRCPKNCVRPWGRPQD